MAPDNESLPNSSSDAGRHAAASHVVAFAATPLCLTLSRSGTPRLPQAAIAAPPANAMIVANDLMSPPGALRSLSAVGGTRHGSQDTMSISLHPPERRRDEWRASRFSVHA